MKKVILYFLILVLFSGFRQENKIQVLVVTGGHDFKEEAFFDVFESFDQVEFTHKAQPHANQVIASNDVDNYDILIFYDMYDQITQKQKQAYKQLLEEGKGMIFLHHTLVSYQDWNAFKNIIGGKYYQEASESGGKVYESTYKHDVDIDVKVEKKDHPIVEGIQDFTIHDEVYGNCEILASVEPLLSTGHPESMNQVAWVNDYANSGVVYIQFGHGPSAFGDDNFRKILKQAIQWSANRHAQ